MKKIINFFKNIFKLIIGFFSEYVLSKAKVKVTVTKKEVEKIEKEIKYISVVGTLPDENSELSIYEERLESFKRNNKIDEELREIIEETLVLIRKINKKVKTDNSLYEYIKATTDLLDSYYEDYSYFISTDKLEYLDELHNKVSKVLKDYYKKEKEYDFNKADNDTKKIDKYGLLKNENKITELLSRTKVKSENELLKEETRDISPKKKKVGLKKEEPKKEKEEVKKENISTEETKKDDTITQVEVLDIEIKKETKEETKEETKKEKDYKDRKKEDEKERLKEEIEEISKSIKLINNYINSNDKLVRNKKNKGLKTLADQSVRIGLSLFPMALFKNKIIGALTSAVILNNTIRSMRRGLNSEVDYIRLSNDDYVTNDSMISKTEDMKIDTLNQIALLKSEIRTQYIVSNDIELLAMYNDIEKIELELKKKEEKEKAKIKIKTNKY